MLAFMYSGQGAQKPFMIKDLYDNYPIVREIFGRGNSVLDFNLEELIFNEASDLNNTEYTQPSLLTISYCIFSILKEKGIAPNYNLGLSLGEYTALVASGVLSYEDAVVLVRKRGQYMNNAVKGLNETGMYAVLKLEEDVILSIIDEVKSLGFISISNYNTIGQIVVAGEIEPLHKFVEIAKEKKGKCIQLNVSGPFHTSLLKEASINLEKEMEKINFNDFNVPVVTNLNGEIIQSREEVKGILTRQVMEPVKWQQSIELLINLGITTFVELGPNKVLSGFVKKIDKELTVLAIEDISTLDESIAVLKGDKK